MKLLILILQLVSVVANARIVEGKPLKVLSDVPAWNQAIDSTILLQAATVAREETGYTECREIAEIKSVYLCASDTSVTMNKSLLRAGMYVEQTIGMNAAPVRLDDPTYLRFQQQIGGHDLKGTDLLRFYEAVKALCQNSGRDRQVCLSTQETEFFENFVLPKALKDPKFIVITYARKSAMTWQKVVSHEIMHAQYFNNPEFQKIADLYWQNSVLVQEKAWAKQRLARYYNTDNEPNLRNEFQAYILMANAEESMLGEMVERHRQPLLQRLNAVGITPLQVK